MAIDFYKSHLQRVSRSFAFCIARLDGDLKDWISLSYLLCRILDTVEDAPWEKSELQIAAYLHFERFLNFPVEESEVRLWRDSFPREIPVGEALLLDQAFQVFSRFHSLPEGIQAVIGSSVRNMYRGMRFFSQRSSRPGNLRLLTLAEVNQYCFFVAGVVGDLLTNLRAQGAGVLTTSAQLLDAHHFGLFLQKVNLLKDQSRDEKEGRFLIAPSRTGLLESAAANAEGALRYIQSIPQRERGYRIFCAWSLFLGLSSLRWTARTTFFGFRLLNKPPRFVTKWMLAEVNKRIDSNDALGDLFHKSSPFSPLSQNSVSSALSPDFSHSSLQVYKGPLGGHEFAALGLL